MVYSYSPSTCLALLETMSETLLDIEYNQIKGSLDLNIHLNTKTRSKPTVTFKKEALKSALSASISDESYTLATQEERILDTVKSITVNKPITVKDVATVTDDDLLPGTLEATVTTSTVPSVDLTPPMELCENINVATSVEDVVEHINFAKIGNREIYYFGNQHYSYGKTVHPPNPYPDVLPDFITEAANKIATLDENFVLNEYSCMVTKYRNGFASTPHHIESENIAKDSKIYLVTIGSNRKMELINQVGRINPMSVEIGGGNIYRSQPESLAKWSKSIIRSDDTNPTITLIFRKLTEPPRKVIPPLGLPGDNMNPKRDILFGKNTIFSSVKNKRTLLLTDSILSAVNPQSLTKSKHEICVKKCFTI